MNWGTTPLFWTFWGAKEAAKIGIIFITKSPFNVECRPWAEIRRTFLERVLLSLILFQLCRKKDCKHKILNSKFFIYIKKNSYYFNSVTTGKSFYFFSYMIERKKMIWLQLVSFFFFNPRRKVSSDLSQKEKEKEDK